MTVYFAFSNQLGPDPGNALTKELGEWALRFLCLTLLITPLRKVTGVPKLIRFRRMFGLFTLFYGLLHTVSYLAFMLGWQWLTLLEDLYQRPYIIIGALAVIILIILGITSTKGMMRRLGRNWSRLHRLVYVAAILAVIHYLWLVKSDYSQPVFYLVVVFALLCFRIPFKRIRS
ncbi:sulfoxide reductase heme-binding subunit YedZ [Endozoicomonas gorgoniicola]|uniref:Protein-methionine-sulfoxide reductase heme-binding subunit MsrQ n=1 Tax=Endozoicomonas gorgoniicola TaxID=1234144 RepID=A0ABT3MZN0_9GAMM|nr:protein-methionine-sulfoxide reductase heme-binding subunit MsrQ [Endozoicomonas gorgoniicola]MCW7554836.1 sulfoxide reductase heme-binding subunit YedZ [Endozoicomonas gorgoniicola]